MHSGSGHSVLVKLHDESTTSRRVRAYEDVQVMWEMPQRAETGRPSPKGARTLVWLRRHHKMDPSRRC